MTQSKSNKRLAGNPSVAAPSSQSNSFFSAFKKVKPSLPVPLHIPLSSSSSSSTTNSTYIASTDPHGSNPTTASTSTTTRNAGHQHDTTSHVSANPSFTKCTTDLTRIVYCDLDGVLVDFDRGVFELTHCTTNQLSSQSMWMAINKSNQFYRNLSWTKDGEQLWDALLPLQPRILTGVPRPKCSMDKYLWCQRNLCVEVVHWDKAGGGRSHQSHKPITKQVSRNRAWCKVITCWSKNKHLECRPNSGDVLIDDRESHRELWEKAGGIFVHHVNTEQTLQTLHQLGILPSHNDWKKKANTGNANEKDENAIVQTSCGT